MRDRKGAARINAAEMPILIERIPCDLDINEIARLEGQLLDEIINLKVEARLAQNGSHIFSAVVGAFNLHLWLAQPVSRKSPGGPGLLMLPASLRLKHPTSYSHVASLRERYAKTLEEQTYLLDRLDRDLACSDLVPRQMFWIGAKEDIRTVRDLQANIHRVLYLNILDLDILLAELMK